MDTSFFGGDYRSWVNGTFCQGDCVYLHSQFGNAGYFVYQVFMDDSVKYGVIYSVGE